MKADFRRLTDPLRAGVARDAADRAERFAQAKVRWPVLTPFDGDAAATRYARDKTVPIELRAPVVRAFIAEYKRTPHPMWAGSILVMFEDLVNSMVYRFRDVRLPDGDLMQVVIMHILQAASKFNVDDPEVLVFLRMKQRANDSAKTELLREKKHRRRQADPSPLDDQCEPEPDDESLETQTLDVAAAPLHPEEREHARYWVVREALARELTTEELAVLEDDGPSLRSQYLGGANADQPGNPHVHRQYQAAKRRLTRERQKVRTKARTTLEREGMPDGLGSAPSVPWLGLG